MGFHPHLPLWAGALLKWAWGSQIPVLDSLCHTVCVQDLKGSIIRSCLQCSDILETKSEDDSKFIILTGTNYSTTPGIQEMSHCSGVQIRRSLTWSPQPELSGSSVVAIWGFVPFLQHRRPCRRDRGLERVLATLGRMRVSSAAL